MAVSKVIYGGQTLIDLTGDSVSAASLGEGVSAHDAQGNTIVGTAALQDPAQIDELVDTLEYMGVSAGADEGLDALIARVREINVGDTGEVGFTAAMSEWVEPGSYYYFDFDESANLAGVATVERLNRITSATVSFQGENAGRLQVTEGGDLWSESARSEDLLELTYTPDYMVRRKLTRALEALSVNAGTMADGDEERIRCGVCLRVTDADGAVYHADGYARLQFSTPTWAAMEAYDLDWTALEGTTWPELYAKVKPEEDWTRPADETPSEDWRSL